MDNKNLRVFLTVLLAACVALLFLKALWFFTDTKSDKIYSQGLEFYNKGDYQNAYYNFKKISVFSPYSVPALYRQACCAWELKDRKTAVKKYAKFAKIYKNTNMAPEAIWKLALLELDEDNEGRAKKYLTRLVHKYPDSDFAKAAAYKLGLLYFNDGEPDKAKKYFVEYIEYAPLGRYSSNVLRVLLEYNPENLEVSDKLFMAESFYGNERYKEALYILNFAPFRDTWLLLSKCYYKSGNYPEFEKNLLMGLNLKGKNPGIDEQDLLNLMRLYVEKSNYPKGAAYNLVLNSKGSIYYPLSLYLYSKYVDYDSSIKNYEKIYADYPESPVADEAAWNVFWHYYREGKYEDALKIAKRYTAVHMRSDTVPKILFWSAKIHIKNGNKKLAKSVLYNIVHNFPDSYYAFRSNAILKKNKTPWKTNEKLKIKDKFSLEKPPVLLNSKEDRLLSRFIALGDYGVIRNFKIDDDFLLSWLEAKDGRKTYSMVLAKDALEKSSGISFSNPKYKLAYPIYYREILNKYAAGYRLSPYLMLAMVREESSFNNEAISPTGAVGLMQLMPVTAKLMDGNFAGADALKDPEYNISLGVKYFAHLMEVFNGNEALCVLAYNSGPGAVQKWLDNTKSGDFDEFVENVPYPETANYIKKVYRSYWVYINVYR